MINSKFSKVFTTLLILVIFLVSTPFTYGQEKQSNDLPKYKHATIVSRDTYKIPEWKKVADALVKKHNGKLFLYPAEGSIPGVQVTRLSGVGCMFKSGIREKDIIATYNGEHVYTPNAILSLIDETKAGTIVPIKLIRDKKELNIEMRMVRIKDKPNTGAMFAKLDINELNTITKELGEYMPHYLAIVAKPQDTNRQFVSDVHDFTKQIDDDPYQDAIWGIVTGYTAENALKIAEYNKPLNIERVVGTFNRWLPRIQEGKCFHDTQDHIYAYKNAETNGKVVEKNDGPLDVTKLFVDELNKDNAQLVWTSSHATEDIFAGFRHNKQTGKIIPKKGKLYGLDFEGKEHEITTTNPKVYYPAGNCLIGHIKNMNSMALAWLNSGAYQFFGYTTPTHYGYQGWGLSHYFIYQNDRYTFAESYYLNIQTMIYDKIHNTPGVIRGKRGLDRYNNNTVFYGDPAWEVRIKNTNPPQPRMYETNFEIKDINDKECSVTFTVTFNSPVQAKSRTGDGNRPAAVLFPYRLGNFKNIKNNIELPKQAILITDNFLMVDFFREEDGDCYVFKKGDKITVSFTAEKLK